MRKSRAKDPKRYPLIKYEINSHWEPGDPFGPVGAGEPSKIFVWQKNADPNDPPPITWRERRFVKALTEGKDEETALAEAGIPGNKLTKTIEKTAPSIIMLMEDQGITDELLFSTLKKGLPVKQTRFIKVGKKIVKEEIEDMATTLGYLKTALTMKGHLKEQKNEVPPVQINFDFSRFMEQCKRDDLEIR
jgi:hypothetical protein